VLRKQNECHYLHSPTITSPPPDFKTNTPYHHRKTFPNNSPMLSLHHTSPAEQVRSGSLCKRALFIHESLTITHEHNDRRYQKKNFGHWSAWRHMSARAPLPVLLMLATSAGLHGLSVGLIKQPGGLRKAARPPSPGCLGRLLGIGHHRQFCSYGHRTLNARLPVRSALVKQCIARLVLWWVTTWESLVL
jgi:hypothetical protein